MSGTNAMPSELITTLTVCILIDGKEILLDVFHNEDIVKGVVISGTHIEPRSVQTINETTFLVTYSSDILAEEIGSAIEKINEWLGKLVVITYDEVTAVQLPQAIEPVHCTTEVEPVVFNSGLEDIR